MDIQQKVKNFVEKHNLEAKPEFRVLDLISELGEVAKALLEDTKYGRKPKSESSIEEELGDLLFSLACLANTYKIDLNGALDKVLAKYEQRIAKKGSPNSKSES